MFFFSVVLPLFNKEEYIARSIQSIKKQSHADFEVFIIDDGSTDASLKMAVQHMDRRFKIITQPNQGVSAARNHGIKLASSEYIAFIDADDKWEADFLYTIKDLIDKFPEAGLYGTGYCIRNNSDEIVKIRQVVNKRIDAEAFLLPNFFRESVKGISPIHSSSVCARKSLLEQKGSFPEGVKFGEDIAVWSKMALTEKIAVSSKIMSNYYAYGINNSSEEKFSTISQRYDYTLLLSHPCTFSVLRFDLERFVEMATLRQAALALRCQKAMACRTFLERIPTRHFPIRQRVLKSLSGTRASKIPFVKIYQRINKVLKIGIE